MRLFSRKKPKEKENDQKLPEQYVICPHCYVDLTVERVQQAGGACPSCRGKIDLDKISRARF